MGIIGVSLISLFSNATNKVMAASLECNAVPDDQVRYVNSTFVDINSEEYNASLRGISASDYYGLNTDQNKSRYDVNSILFGSIEGRVRGGFQNGYRAPGKSIEVNGVIQGLAEPTLSNGNLKIVSTYNNGTSLFPLSDTDTTYNAYNEVLTNWKFPFKKDSNGYYSFNSDEYHVSKDYSTKTFKLHKGVREGFFPFNSCSDDTTNWSSVRNVAFTARFEIPFVMTTDGKIKNSTTNSYEDMIFNFSGDDDVWVYIDDKLVLDMGGNHDRITGSINFAKNETKIDRITNSDGLSTSNNVTAKAFSNGLLSAGKHTLKLFYMERAGGTSNLITTFNLQSAGLEARYIDKITGEILDKQVFSGGVGDSITLENREFDGYSFVSGPDTLEYSLTEDLNIVNFYYQKESTVTIKYLDEADDREIAETQILYKKQGDSFSSEKLDITDYTFDKVVGKESGTMGRENIEIIYYYKYNCKLTVNHIDQDTGEIIEKEDITGGEGEEKTTTSKNFENYILVESPENEKYNLTKKEIVVNYYYKYISKVEVKHLEEGTDRLLGSSTIENVVGTKVNTEAIEINGFKLVKKPETEEYIITRDVIEVKYYYKEIFFNLKVDLNLEKTVINESYFKLKGKIGKIETKISEANSNSSSKIYYNLKVSNNEERVGSGRITDTIPESYYMIPEENGDWTYDENTNTAYLDVHDMNPNETREFKIVLTKKEGLDVCGTIINKVDVTSTSLEENNLNDNSDKNDLVILPRTGLLKKLTGPKALLSYIAFIITSTLAILIYRKKHKKGENIAK
jgi:fibro-slime domain-containing protein